MGVVNVTPDSFSDGGWFLSAADAIAHGRRLAAEGAALVDVGGEPSGAEPVDEEEELRRVVPVLEGLAGVAVSIDTSKSAAKRALELGAELVNDVTSLRGDPGLAGAVAEHDAYLCLMHMQGEPRLDADGAALRRRRLRGRRVLEELTEHAVAEGVRRESICVDPGIGFGKTPDQNLELVRRLDVLVGLGYPVLVGSRGRARSARSWATRRRRRARSRPRSAAPWRPRARRSMLRVHDVRETVERSPWPRRSNGKEVDVTQLRTADARAFLGAAREASRRERRQAAPVRRA